MLPGVANGSGGRLFRGLDGGGMSARSRRIAKSRAQGKRWDEAKEAVFKLDGSQQIILVRAIVADRWMRLHPVTQVQEHLKKRVAERMKQLMGVLESDLRELEEAVKVNRIQSHLPHLKAADNAYAARGAWAMKAVRILASMPEHRELAERGHKLWTGFDAADGWKLPEL